MSPAEPGPRSTRTARRCVALVLAFSAAASAAPTQVATAVAERVPVARDLLLSGTLTAVRSAGLSPRVDGLVSHVAVDAGDRVRAGDVVLRLDDALARATQRRAAAEQRQSEAARDEARRRVEEARRLVAERHVPQTELAAREAALAQAEAASAAARAALHEQEELVRRHQLVAPFDGVIAARAAEAGEWVSRGDEVLHLVSLSGIRLDVHAPQEYLGALGLDTPVDIRPDTDPERVVPARVVARVPVGGGAGSRTFLVRVEADTDEVRLFPGTSAAARFRLASADLNAVRVPRDALLRHPDGGYSVFVVEQGADGAVARRRPVRVGHAHAEAVEVLEGVTQGDIIVTRGNEALSDGDAVVTAGTP